MSKTIFRTLLSLLLGCSLLCACTPVVPSGNTTQPTTVAPQPSYAGTMEGYEYFHSNQRDRAWEADILYLAEGFLAEHPYLADKNIFISSSAEIFHALEVDYSDVLYNEELRSSFIKQINELISQIPAFTDAEIVYALKSIVASLGDLHSNLTAIDVSDKIFPLYFEHITEETGVSLYAICVPVEHGDIYLSKLTAINGVEINEVITRLSAYVSAENEYYPIYATVKPRSGSYSMLTLANALQAIGVVEGNSNSAEFTFETEEGTVTRMFEAITTSEYKQLTMIRHTMSTDERLLYKYDKFYWYELLEPDVLYVRFAAIKQEADQPINQFLNEVSAIVRNSEQPLRLIMDFRYNGGGSDYSNAFKSFVASLNNCTTDGCYILINGGNASAGVYFPYCLSRSIKDAVLIGSPTAQFVNCPADPYTYTLPNSGYKFYVSSRYYYYAPQESADALHPDVLLYQTWEDYVDSVDTVLEYVLDVSVADEKEES